MGRTTGPNATPGTTGVPVRTTRPVVVGRDAVPEEVMAMGTSMSGRERLGRDPWRLSGAVTRVTNCS